MAFVPVGLSAELLITQYYEGSSNNKFLELTNTGDSAVDLSTYTVTRWSNATTEDWKNVGTLPGGEVTLSGSLGSGESYVLANSSAAVPYSAAEADTTSGVITFNGDDSVVLYEGLDSETLLPIFDPANIVDALSFTDFGDEGKDISIVRKIVGIGYDLNPGSIYRDFPAIWEEVALEDVNNAVLGDNLYLGSSSLGANVPLVSFSSSVAVVGEQTPSVELEIQLLNPGPEAVSVDIVFDAGNSTAVLADIGDYATQTVTFPAGSSSGDTQTVTVTLTDDEDAEAAETAIFLLENVVTTGDAIAGGNESMTVTIQDNDTVIPKIYISEIADPSDNFSARFVEIHNPTDAEVDLEAGGWNLVVYFNDSTSGNEIPLTGTIPPGGVYLIVQDDFEFAEAYPDAPLPNVVDSDINFNGDDNIELRFGGGVATGILVDIYGEPGVDGTDSDREFTDSQVTRAVAAPNAVFTLSEWVITPDSGVAAMTPGSIGPVDPPNPEEIVISNISVNHSTGQVVLTASGLGTATYIVESSLDLGISDAWAEVPGGFAETDVPEGVEFSFSDPEASSEATLYYRIVED